MKKTISVIILLLVAVFCGTTAFAASSININVKSSWDTGSVYIDDGGEKSCTVTLELGSSAAGQTVAIRLFQLTSGNDAIFGPYGTATTLKASCLSAVDGNGMPVPFAVANGLLVVECPSEAPYSVTCSLVISSLNATSSGGKTQVYANTTCSASITGDVASYTLADWLSIFEVELSDIASNTDSSAVALEAIKGYAQYLSSIDADTSLIADNIYWMAKDLAAISYDVQGAVTGGKSYSVLLQEILAAISNISFGDIGDITVATDLTEVLTRLDAIFSALDNLENIEDKTAYLSTQLTELIALLTEQKDSLDAIGLDVQALLDLLGSDEFLGYIEDRLDLLLEEQKISNKVLQDILTVLQNIRDSLVYGGSSGGSGGSSSVTGNTFAKVLDTLLGGVLDLLGNLLGMLFKLVFGLFGWLTDFVGWVNTTYLGGFFPAAIWGPISILIPLIIVLGLIRFVRGFF